MTDCFVRGVSAVHEYRAEPGIVPQALHEVVQTAKDILKGPKSFEERKGDVVKGRNVTITAATGTSSFITQRLVERFIAKKVCTAC